MVLSRCRDIGEFCNLSLSDHSSIHVEFRPPRHPRLEEEMKAWLSRISERGETITDAKIQKKALEIADNLRLKYGYIGSEKGKEKNENFKASPGWIENFKHRHDVKGGTWYGRPEASEPEIVGVPMAPQEPGTVQLLQFQKNITSNRKWNKSWRLRVTLMILKWWKNCRVASRAKRKRRGPIVLWCITSTPTYRI